MDRRSLRRLCLQNLFNSFHKEVETVMLRIQVGCVSLNVGKVFHTQTVWNWILALLYIQYILLTIFNKQHVKVHYSMLNSSLSTDCMFNSASCVQKSSYFCIFHGWPKLSHEICIWSICILCIHTIYCRNSMMFWT